MAAWWISSVTEYSQVFISCCSNGGSCKVLPAYSTVDVSNTFSEPELSNDCAARDKLPPDENRWRRLEANVINASPDLWYTLSPPLADRRRVTAAAVSVTSAADTCRRRCCLSTSRQINTGQGACRMMSSLAAPRTVRLKALEPLRVPITMYEAFSSNAMRQTTSPGLPGHERSRADTFKSHQRHCRD